MNNIASSNPKRAGGEPPVKLKRVSQARLIERLREDDGFNSPSPRQAVVARLKVSGRETIQYSWLVEKRFGAQEKLREWIERYADLLENCFKASMDELSALRESWEASSLRPNAPADVSLLHNELVHLGDIRKQLAQGKFQFDAATYESVSYYEPQRALALSAARSWCVYNGLPIAFDGCAIWHALQPDNADSGFDWRQAACAPFLMPGSSASGYGFGADERSLAHCLTPETQMPINFGYPLPPAVFEDYARLCYRLVVRDQHPSFVKSDRYNPYSNVLLAWYFQKELSITEIARRLGIARATVERQIASLIELFNLELPEGATPLQKRPRNADEL